MARFLITGGAGFIGSNLVRRLTGLGHSVRVADNFWRGSRANLEEDTGACVADELLELDLTDPESARRAVAGVDTIVHLAAVVGGTDFVFENEPQVFRDNLLINSNVLEAARAESVGRFLYLGTACSYPTFKQQAAEPQPLREEEVYPAQPESGYGWSRLMGEYESQLHERYYGLQLCVLRAHNAYGPYSDVSLERSQVIPALIRRAIRHPEEPFVVWGNGEDMRDFLFVDDVVDAILLGLELGIGKGPIQIGSGQATSTRRLAETIVRLSGKEIPIEFDDSPRGQDRTRVADCSRAKELLGWSAATSLEEGLARTYRWTEARLRTAEGGA